MGDLSTDSAPLGRMTGRVVGQEGQEAAPHPAGGRRQAPQVFNITGSSGVHIGPVIHNPAAPPRPRPAPKDMPTKKEVDDLRRCGREVSERDKQEVGEHLGAAWASLGRAMGFSPGQLDNLAADVPRAADRTHELLQRWHDREAERATLAALTELLLDVRAFSVVKRLRP